MSETYESAVAKLLMKAEQFLTSVQVDEFKSALAEADTSEKQHVALQAATESLFLFAGLHDLFKAGKWDKFNFVASGNAKKEEKLVIKLANYLVEQLALIKNGEQPPPTPGEANKGQPPQPGDDRAKEKRADLCDQIAGMKGRLKRKCPEINEIVVSKDAYPALAETLTFDLGQFIDEKVEALSDEQLTATHAKFQRVVDEHCPRRPRSPENPPVTRATASQVQRALGSYELLKKRDPDHVLVQRTVTFDELRACAQEEVVEFDNNLLTALGELEQKAKDAAAAAKKSRKTRRKETTMATAKKRTTPSPAMTAEQIATAVVTAMDQRDAAKAQAQAQAAAAGTPAQPPVVSGQSQPQTAPPALTREDVVSLLEEREAAARIKAEAEAAANRANQRPTRHVLGMGWLGWVTAAITCTLVLAVIVLVVYAASLDDRQPKPSAQPATQATTVDPTLDRIGKDDESGQ